MHLYRNIIIIIIIIIAGDFLCIHFVCLISQKCIILENNFGFMPYELLLDIWYMPLRIALFIDNYDFMTTCVQYLRLNNVRLCNSTYDTLIVSVIFHPCSFCPSFSSPAFSSPALLSVIFQSCIFQPCTFVRHFPVLQIPALHFCPSFSSPAFSCPANSVAPYSPPPNPQASGKGARCQNCPHFVLNVFCYKSHTVVLFHCYIVIVVFGVYQATAEWETSSQTSFSAHRSARL